MAHYLEDALELNFPAKASSSSGSPGDVTAAAARLRDLHRFGAFTTVVQRTPLESEPSRTYEGFRLANLGSADSQGFNDKYACVDIKAFIDADERTRKLSADPKYNEMHAFAKAKWEAINQGGDNVGVGAMNQNEVSFLNLLMKHLKRLSKSELPEEQRAKRLSDMYKWFQQEADRIRKSRDKMQLRQTDVKAAQLPVGTVVYIWVAYLPSLPRSCSGWYLGRVKADNCDGTYEVLLQRGDRQRRVPRKWIRSDTKLQARQKKLKDQEQKRQKMRALGEQRHEDRKGALLDCQEPKYEDIPTLVGLEKADGEVNFSESATVEQKTKVTWTLGKSVWAMRQKNADSGDFYDTDEIKAQAFEADWKRSHLGKENQKVVDPAQLDAVKAILRKHYPLICRLLILQGAFSPLLPFTVSWNGFRDLMHDSNIMEPGQEDNGFVEAADQLFIQVNLEMGAEEKQLDNSNKALERFEMLEMIVRLAKLKFMSGHPGLKANNEEEAVKMIFDMHFCKYDSTLDKDEWRKARMYHEDVDVKIRSYSRSLKDLYESMCSVGDKANFGRKLHMSAVNYESYLKMCADKQLLANEASTSKQRPVSAGSQKDEKDELGKRGAALAFLLSRMMLRDEMEVITKGRTSRKKTLTYADFLEMMCRLADMLDRGEDKGCRAWDVKTEGTERPLEDALDKFLGTTLGLKRTVRKARKASANVVYDLSTDTEGTDDSKERLSRYESELKGKVRSLGSNNMRSEWRNSDIRAKPERRKRPMTFKCQRGADEKEDQWLKVPSSLESILHGQHVQQQRNRGFLAGELHKVEGRQPCRMLTQFDALPLVKKKYVSGHSTKVGGGYGMGRAGPGGRLGGLRPRGTFN